MTRASCITLLATVVLSSFAGLEDRIPRDSVEADRPFTLTSARKFVGKRLSGLDCGRPVFWGERIFLPEFDRTNKQLATLCIDRRTGKVLWRRTVATEAIEKVHEISSPAASTPATD